MPPAPRVLLFSPMPLLSGRGNAVSALRMALRLREAGIDATATDDPAQALQGAALLVLNAWRSHAVAMAFRAAHPDRPLIAVITGTDVYPSGPAHPELAETLTAADAIAAWQAHALASLPPAFQAKARVIPKSVSDLPRAPVRRPDPDHFLVAVIGHLRPVKDPFAAARAALRLPADSRIRVVQAGGEAAPGMADEARALMAETPRYQWLGGLPREGVWDLLQRSHCSVNSSFVEGGANAVVESLLCGTPVLASGIPGNTGFLGPDWPGLFPAGDHAALAALLTRAETDPAFPALLADHTARLREQFLPGAEREALVRLVADATAARHAASGLS